MSRRLFLQRLSAAAVVSPFAIGASTTHAVTPFARAGKPRLLSGLAAYSLRDFFKDSDHKRDHQIPESDRIDMFQFIDYCADQGCDGAELTSYYFPANVTDDYLLRVKRHAFLRGVAISGGAIGNTFTHPPGERRDAEMALTRRWIDRTAVMGTTHLRVFAGDLRGATVEEAKKRCIGALEECAAYAGTRGVVLGLENHGGIVAEADDILEILRAVQSPWVGINLDTGNFHTADPYRDLERCAPYAVNVQFKVEMEKKGGPKEEADLERAIKILRSANYQGYVTLEYEAAENPYSAIPRHMKRIKSLLSPP